MDKCQDEDLSQLITRLTTGFGAMLQQVQELSSKNTELERRLARIREEVPHPLFAPCLLQLAMMSQNSSRSRATKAAVIENIPTISEHRWRPHILSRKLVLATTNSLPLP